MITKPDQSSKLDRFIKERVMNKIFFMQKRSSLATRQMYDSGPIIKYQNKMAAKRLLYKVRLNRLRDNDWISEHILVRILKKSGYRGPVIEISL